MFIDQKAIDYFSNKMVLAKINAERDSSWINDQGDTVVTAVKTAVSLDYHISGYPTMVLVDGEGTEIDRIVGYMEVDDLIKTLDDYQNGIGTLADLLSKAEGAEDRALFLEIADKYKYRGAPDEATNWYEKVVEGGDRKDSLSGESRMALADMLRRAKDYDSALKAYKSVAKDFKKTAFGADAQIYQAIVYRSMGDTTEAISAFESFIENNPESEDVEYANKQIKKLSGSVSE